ncbi:MAG: HlyD family type I secretion periplasmic adaptor subunit [Leptolyngbyaceae cyanobacterium bins.302]|nr:HlyD family type I secretion periplasmic adaptor subunit [Leptolyngbyaceae cyanobacterium bins.302]
MKFPHWLFNPFATVHSKLNVLDPLDDSAGTLGLPSPGKWTQRITLLILLGLGAGTAWAVVARVDVVIAARGKLEPLSQSQSVQSKVGGVVTTVLVREGQTVKQGQLLLQLDKTTLQNQLKTLMLQRNQLVKETAVLRLARQGRSLATLQQTAGTIPPELMNQVQTRLLLQAKLSQDPGGLSPEQFERYALFQQQLRDRQSITSIQGANVQTQIAETEAQLAKTEFQFKVERKLLSQLTPLMEQGAISRTDFLRRAVDVNTLQSQVNQTRLQKRELQLNHLQARAESQKLMTETFQDLQRQLAEVDTQFDSTIKNNQRQLIQINAQLNQLQTDLKSQDLRSPADGIVFNIGPKLPGVVAQPGQALLQVVPNESLISRVQVANADIANIQVGTPVEIRIDAYPFTEYGSVKGVIAKVGREALTMNQQAEDQTVFPVEVRLDRQFLERKNERHPLVPGMTLVANIKVRQRAPISYVADEVIKAFDGARSVR